MFSWLLSKYLRWHHWVIIILSCFTWGEMANTFTCGVVVNEPASTSFSLERWKYSVSNTQCNEWCKCVWDCNGDFLPPVDVELFILVIWHRSPFLPIQNQQIIAFLSHLGKHGSFSLGFGLLEKRRGKPRNPTNCQIKMSISGEPPCDFVH